MLVAEEHEIRRLWPDPQSVWDIYEAARKENEEDDDTKCIDEQMNKSRGLPLAIRLMATLLPVFLDTESTAHDGSANETTSEENRSIELLLHLCRLEKIEMLFFIVLSSLFSFS